MSGQVVGYVVIELEADGVACVDWLGPTVSHDQAVELLAVYGQEHSEIDWVLARVVLEEDS